MTIGLLNTLGDLWSARSGLQPVAICVLFFSNTKIQLVVNVKTRVLFKVRRAPGSTIQNKSNL